MLLIGFVRVALVDVVLDFFVAGEILCGLLMEALRCRRLSGSSGNCLFHHGWDYFLQGQLAGSFDWRLGEGDV